jgi:hypothetical protein
MKAARAWLPGPASAQLDRRLNRRIDKFEKRLSKRVSKIDRGLARLGKAVEKERRAREGKQPRWTYNADGLATVHLSPFLEDATFSDLYEEMASEWFQHTRAEARWRLWLLTRFARQCEVLEGSFAEFGTYRGGCAFMILALTEVERFYLFDTFKGIPSDRLTEHEALSDMAGALGDTSAGYVAQRLSRWAGRFELCPGDVFETLPQTETGPLSFVHMDLNAAAPTALALEYAYPRLVAGGMMAFDDYGWHHYRDQRTIIDDFFSNHPGEVIALPTGQGILVKKGSISSQPHWQAGVRLASPPASSRISSIC